MAATFLCQFIPIVPELEDDVDLTQEEPHMPVVVPGSATPSASPMWLTGEHTRQLVVRRLRIGAMHEGMSGGY
ncbi:hypothetical protein L839_4143 [Mycobacterium avium MAV_120809_2495]|nr:hypothetical protein L839_4143 [Mycobacterium avium MAV_120809_2495]